MNRKTEIRNLLALSPAEVRRRAGQHLIVCHDVEELHQRMAEDILDDILAAQHSGQPCRLILPVGPTGQYIRLARMINEQDISLAHCWFFFMDDYCDEQGNTLSPQHPLSFQGVANQLFLGRLDPDCGLQPAQVIFPNEQNITQLPAMIQQAGGIDVCYGGIGIHGHLAFNEPEPNVKNSITRRVKLNDFTVTINAIRAQVGGNLENFPREAYTLGMSEILSAPHIRLYCRNGSEYDWANTVLRLALFGTPGDDYPVTHIRDKDFVIITDEATLRCPDYVI
jgi:glucosamine-6-phosphate deaminase